MSDLRDYMHIISPPGDKAAEEAAMLADMEARHAKAAELMEADPALGYISAVVMAGDLLSAERSERWMDEGLPFIHAYPFVGSFARFGFVVKAWQAGKVDDAWFFEHLPGLWVGADPDDTDPVFVDIWRQAWERNGRHRVLDGSDLRVDARNPRSTEVTVYRGQRADAPIGLSWTTDEAIARKFANGAGTRGPLKTEMTIYQMRIPLRAVFAYLTGRGENEVIVDPSYVEAVR